jgi:ATPase subunit of ABC transporter with duplicated ATPase domains|tara:strand:+ start:78 stop:578 length:501 start_codon:yes stop_codon:yes gene_type:complete
MNYETQTNKQENEMTYTELKNQKLEEYKDNFDSYLQWKRENREMLMDMEREEKIAKIKEVKAFANRTGYSDVNPCEVIKVISDKCVEIRDMDTKQLEWKRDWSVGGFAGHLNNQRDQKWEITSNENNPVYRIRFSNPKKGYTTWKDKHGRTYSMHDEAIKFYDYNF